MSFEIRFIPTAEKTYKTLVNQLQQRWGDRFVTKLDNKIEQSLNIISASPYIYQVADESTGTRKCVLHKNCSMFYKVYEDARIIQIVWFWDNRQDPIFTP
jgi:plasmid stabilization system protein ParE